MKFGAVFGLGIAVLWSALALMQLWWEIFAGETFFKITITCGILLGLTVVGALVYREYVRDNELRDKGFID